MASTCVKILGVASLCWLPVVADKPCDGETFPLSGGIDDGVEVSIKSKIFDDRENAIIEFLTPDRKVAFRWKVGKTKIFRSSDMGADESTTSGGLPEGLKGEGQKTPTFVFTKRKLVWAVSIATGNGDPERYQWYDFLHKQGSDTLVTHVRVCQGLKVPEVTLQRPQCKTQCHKTECTCEGQACWVVKPDGNCKSESEKETTPGAQEHCCDGLQKDICHADDYERQWLSVIEDANALRAICKAFKDDYPDVSICKTFENLEDFESLAGKKMGLNEKHTKKETHSGFVPFFQGTADADFRNALFTLPCFALAETKLNKQFPRYPTYVAPGKSDLRACNPLHPKDEFCDHEPGAVSAGTEVIVRSADESFPKGWFFILSMLQLDGQNRSMPYGSGRGKLFKQAFQFYLADEEVERPAGQCVDAEMLDSEDDPNEHDAQHPGTYPGGLGCGNYTDMCNMQGEATVAFCEKYRHTDEDGKCGDDIYGGNQRLPAADPQRASYQCCICGGGSYGDFNEDSTESNEFSPLTYF